MQNVKEEKRVWGIHTTEDHLFLDNNVIAIGWRAMGDLSLIDVDRETFKDKYKQLIPLQKVYIPNLKSGE